MTTTWTPGAAASTEVSSGAASTTCSKLSQTTSIRRARRAVVSATSASSPAGIPRAEQIDGTDVGGLLRLGERDEGDAVGVSAREAMAQLDRHSRLAHPSRTDDAQETGAGGHQVVEPGQLVLPPHGLVEEHRQRPRMQRTCRGPAKLFLVGELEQLAVERTQRRRRLDAELVMQGPPQIGVDGQRLAPTTGPVQGLHQSQSEPLAQRLAGHERSQLGYDGIVPAQRQVSLDPRGQGAEAELVQPGRLDVRERRTAHVRERRPPPEGQRRAQGPGRGVRLATRQLVPAALQPVGEVDGIHRRELGEPVAVALSHDDVRARRTAQRRDVDLDAVDGRDRRLRTPQPVHQLGAADGVRLVGGEQRQQLRPPGSAEIDVGALATALDRSEQEDVQRRRRHPAPPQSRPRPGWQEGRGIAGRSASTGPGAASPSGRTGTVGRCAT